MKTNKDLPTVYQSYIHRSRYARYIPENKKRETWEETVERYITNTVARRSELSSDVGAITNAILNLEIMPSMRALMTAGPALERNHIAAYNCAYAAVDHVRFFDECLLILMHGTGVGFSVERQFINDRIIIKLHRVARWRSSHRLDGEKQGFTPYIVET